MSGWKLSGAIGVAVMAVALVYGFGRGGFAAEGAAILDLTWGRVTLIDLYTGIGLATAWVWWRDRSWRSAVPWTVAFLLLGNLAVAGYVLTRARRANSPAEFFLGDHA
jgi:hypothetical protein